jgi:hypothetical protein
MGLFMSLGIGHFLRAPDESTNKDTRAKAPGQKKTVT